MPLVSTLVDDFSTDQRATLWPGSYGTSSVSGGSARLVCDTGYNAIRSAQAYTPAGSAVYAKMTPPAASTAAEAYVEMKVESATAGTEITANIDAALGRVRCSNSVGYFDPGGVEEPYDAHAHRYLRIREAGGTLYWEKSPDRVVWTVMRSTATPAWFASTTTASVLFQSHRDAGTADEALVDDVNVPVPTYATFPTAPLPVSVWLAPGADPAGDPGNWSWSEITDDVRVQNGIVIEQGRGDEAARVDPGRCSLTLDNRSGNYSPRNPAGVWFGQLAKNTPLQVRLERGSDTFERAAVTQGWGTSTSGRTWGHTGLDSWSTTGSVGRVRLAVANSAVWGILGSSNARDVDMVFSATMPVVTTGAPMIVGAVVRYTDTNNAYRVFTEFKPAGEITIKIMRRKDGLNTDLAENLDPGVSYSAGAKVWVRVQADGPTIRQRIWLDGDPEPTEWQLSTDDATELLGTGPGFYVWRFVGNTNVGDLHVDIDDVAISALLFTGTVAEWPVRWDQSANDCVTTIQASGILRRLQQGSSALRSPLYRQLTRYNPAGYWPLEDGQDATIASSAVAGGTPATVLDVTFAADDTLPGGETALKLNSSSSKVSGIVRRSTGSGGWAAMLLFKLAAIPSATPQTLVSWGCSGTVKTWRIRVDNAGFWMEGLDADDVVITGGAGPAYAVDVRQWVAVQLEAVQSGANIDWDMLWHQVGDDVFWAYSGIEPGTVGTITSFVIPGSAAMTDAAVSHVYVGHHSLPFVADSFSQVSNGYSGELGSDRVQRLCDEEGVRVFVEAGDSQPQGRQRAASFLELLQAVEDADQGVLYERGTALAYKPSGARFNVPVSVALDFEQGHIAAPPEPTDDDQRVRNDITAKRDAGGEAHEADEAHIALNGRYDEAVTVNVATDEQLVDAAGWRLHLGTWDAMRWPRIELNLARNVGLIPYWLTMGVGSRFTLDNPPSQVAGDALDLVVEGFTQTLGPYGWDVELNCSPAQPWDVAVADDTDDRVDTDLTTLAAPATAGATELVVTSWDQVGWTVDPADLPLDLNVGGERVTVTAVSDRGLIADDFTRNVSNGWGVDSSAIAWTHTGAAARFHANGSRGVYDLNAAGLVLVSSMPIGFLPGDIRLRWRLPAAPTGSGNVLLNCRVGDADSTYVALNVQFNVGGTQASHWMNQVVGGVETTFVGFPSTGVTGLTTALLVRIQLTQTEARCRVWAEGATEPGHWTVTLPLTEPPPSAPSINLRASRSAGTTNAAPFYVEVDDLVLEREQELTVIRAVNGVALEHDTGTDVRLWRPTFLSM